MSVSYITGPRGWPKTVGHDPKIFRVYPISRVEKTNTNYNTAIYISIFNNINILNIYVGGYIYLHLDTTT